MKYYIQFDLCSVTAIAAFFDFYRAGNLYSTLQTMHLKEKPGGGIYRIRLTNDNPADINSDLDTLQNTAAAETMNIRRFKAVLPGRK